MATTALIFEIIIIGFQVIVWILLLLSIPFGFRWLDELKELKDWAIIGSAVFIGFSYILGVMFNQFSMRVLPTVLLRKASDGFILKHFSHARKSLEEKILPMTPTQLRVYIWTKDTQTANRLEVWARQCVMLRATAVNVPIICFLGLILTFRGQGFSWPLFCGGLLSVVIVVFSLWIWDQAVSLYYHHLGETYAQLTKPQSHRGQSE